MSGEAIKLGKLEVRYLVDGAATGGLGVFELTVPPGAIVPPPHSHTDNEECIYTLEGALRYSVDRESRELKPGTGCRPRAAPCITSSIVRTSTCARPCHHDAGYRRAVLSRCRRHRQRRRRAARSNETPGSHVEIRVGAGRAGGRRRVNSQSRGGRPVNPGLAAPTSVEALVRHRAAHAVGPESRRVRVFSCACIFRSCGARACRGSARIHGPHPSHLRGDLARGGPLVHAASRRPASAR